MSDCINAPDACEEKDVRDTIFMLARRLLDNPENLIQSGERIALEVYLAKHDAISAIKRAKETT